jgi:hypothetical protein
MLKVPLVAVNTFLLREGKISEPVGKNSIPVQMWIRIGMNEKKIGYWDDSSSYIIYIRQGGFDKAKSAQIYTELIKKDIEKKGFKPILKVYIKKNAWLWTEGTYQAEYYGIGSWGYLYPTFATKIVIHNKELRDSVRWILHAINLMMLGIICAGLLRTINKRSVYPFILPAIVLLGFICFYTLWEIKPRYIYPVYPYMMLMFYYGLGITVEKLKKVSKMLCKRKKTIN